MKFTLRRHGVALLLALGLSAPTALNPLEPAYAAPVTGERISSEDGAVWSASYARQNWSPGLSTVIAVRAQHPGAIAIATPLAVHLGAPLLIVEGSGGTQDAETFAALDALRPQKALLVGPDWSPKHAVYGGIAQRVSTTESLNGPGLIGLSQVVAQKFTSSDDATLLASGGGTDMVTAASAAAVLNTPLLLTDPGYSTFADGTVNELKRLGTKRVHQVGTIPNADLEPVAKALTGASIDLSAVVGTTPEQRNSSVSALLESKNIDSGRVYVGSSGNTPTALNGALAVARAGAFLHLATGPDTLPDSIRDLVAGWGPETEKIVLLGGTSQLSTSFESAIKNAVQPRTPKPAFSIQSFAKTAQGTIAITLTPQASATSYSVFDLEGSQVASGATPTFQLPSLTTTFKVQAKNGSQILAERDVRISEGNESSGQAERVATSAYNGSITLNWSEAAAGGARPHKVLRTSVTRGPDGSLQQGDQKLIGITCLAEFTDPSPTTPVQNVYSVEAFGSPIGNACDAARTKATDGTARTLTGLNVPTGLPGATGAAPATMSAQSTDGSKKDNAAPTREPSGPRATPTLGEAALLRAKADAKAKKDDGAKNSTPELTSTAASMVLPWKFRYRMFLSQARVRPVPWNPQVMYGDGRGFSAWQGTHRTQVDTTFNFDSNWQVTGATFEKNVGQSIEYSCPWWSDYDGCSETGRRTASDAGIGTLYQPRTYYQPFPYARITHAVADPFPVKGFSSWWGDVYAPPIRYVAQYNYLYNGFWLSGALACAPEQEIWGGFVPGEWQPILLYRPACPLAVGAVAGPLLPYVFKM